MTEEIEVIDEVEEEEVRQPNLVNAILAGAFGATVGASLWTAIGLIFDIQIGIVAILVGVIVGYMVNRFGQGYSDLYRVIGAVFALIGCVLGKYSVIFLLVAEDYGVPVVEVIGVLDGPMFLEFSKAIFSMTDLAFFAFAVFEGYKLSVQVKEDPRTTIV